MNKYIPSKSTQLNSAVSARELEVKYDYGHALFDVNFEIPVGRKCAVIGPNGAGKSTLFKSILGLAKISRGSVEVFGRSFNPRIHNIAYIPQQSKIDLNFPVTALDVVMMAFEKVPQFWSRKRKEFIDLGVGALEQVGLSNVHHKLLGELSGGQRQRVFLARALLREADLYLLDEPFSGVDIQSYAAIDRILSSICGEGRTAIVIHHDLRTVKERYDYILMLNKRVVFAGPAREAWTPEYLSATFGHAYTDASSKTSALFE